MDGTNSTIVREFLQRGIALLLSLGVVFSNPVRVNDLSFSARRELGIENDNLAVSVRGLIVLFAIAIQKSELLQHLCAIGPLTEIIGTPRCTVQDALQC